jgi:hypothetical protein
MMDEVARANSRDVKIREGPNTTDTVQHEIEENFIE